MAIFFFIIYASGSIVCGQYIQAHRARELRFAQVQIAERVLSFIEYVVGAYGRIVRVRVRAYVHQETPSNPRLYLEGHQAQKYAQLYMSFHFFFCSCACACLHCIYFFSVP